eukprot:CAMPEP_0172720810 /NCGR_PEP_ID=MMETSP1074-20121228/77738_1 /TAXON_ID=2916 /ORGANISM="Ceratium fusus, Strain PA161109" /LENGTH=38 /DNA_ID= /DNA_START= /DNA_END= /DNA_ORIENTATION=
MRTRTTSKGFARPDPTPPQMAPARIFCIIETSSAFRPE